MQRKIIEFNIANEQDFKEKLLQWGQSSREVVFFDSNEFKDSYSEFEYRLAIDAFTSIQTDYEGAFEALQAYYEQTQDWLFGYLGYDLKNDIEDTTSDNFDGLNFPELFFFQPQKVFTVKGDVLEMAYLNVVSEEIESDFEAIRKEVLFEDLEETKAVVLPRIDKETYVERVAQIIAAIASDTLEELNYCMEFYAENIDLNPLKVYQNLNAISTPPFACFFKRAQDFAFCASPERYLKKKGSTLITQPIKGTAKRHHDEDKDAAAIAYLKNSPKERAENVLTVAQVKKDLEAVAVKGSIEVTELCEVYSFQQVHQMISTVTAEVAENQDVVELVQKTFPMGSMVGAPRVESLKLIEALEETKRGLYSGAMGYFSPNGDFDFNVIIRSILYNSQARYASFIVGSGITALANPESEYDECLLKGNAMRNVLES